jgi:hypothetical protein
MLLVALWPRPLLLRLRTSTRTNARNSRVPVSFFVVGDRTCILLTLPSVIVQAPPSRTLRTQPGDNPNYTTRGQPFTLLGVNNDSFAYRPPAAYQFGYGLPPPSNQPQAALVDARTAAMQTRGTRLQQATAVVAQEYYDHQRSQPSAQDQGQPLVGPSSSSRSSHRSAAPTNNNAVAGPSYQPPSGGRSAGQPNATSGSGSGSGLGAPAMSRRSSSRSSGSGAKFYIPSGTESSDEESGCGI